ncbi:MAG: hypothetical protein AMS17_09505 [Spirochaetes bacterium DG_61]|jgi:hypothetical protein|nr:MAG: hypothetical protein AMS17_09505 [Spirochaetes bacterium DG_61]
MKRVLIFLIIMILIIGAGITYAQRVVRLGDLPKSESVVNIYQVYGFQEAHEGYKITYIGNNNEPQHLYLPVELLDKVRIYSPQANTYSSNFLIIWKQDNRITKVEWFKPREIDYRLPNYSLRPFEEKDKDVFSKIVDSGELILGTDVGGLSPTIRAPGGNE